MYWLLKKITIKKIDEDLAKRFQNNCNFCDGDINKFCLMLQKNIYPYEYLDSWQRFNETSFPDKNEFYSNLTMENITDANYKHARIV